jgi:hypothetical protein
MVMTTVDLTATHIKGLFWGSDGRLYCREDGAERECSRCGQWDQTAYRWSDHFVCGRHVRVVPPARIRLTTAFACRVFRTGEVGWPAATVLRRGDTLEVIGRPERQGHFDRFVVDGGRGFVLVPRSRWAWLSSTRRR